MSDSQPARSQIISERWKGLLRNLISDAPPRNMTTLYVEPKRSCAGEIAAALGDDPNARRKFLLVGARGGGKSTELRRIAELLGGKMTLATVDLDASGVRAGSVSAFDLLYISGLALLDVIKGTPEAATLFDDLANSFGGSSRPELGDFKTALAGLASFAKSVSAAAGAIGLDGGAAAAAGLFIEAGSAGIRLLSQPTGVVHEASPSGRALLLACQKIARSVRTRTGRPVCVLVDGLEKMNGESEERFRQIFEHTAVLANPEWNAVIAAPPATLTHTSAVANTGYAVEKVWGFGPDDYSKLKELLLRRFEDANVDPHTFIEGDFLGDIVTASGGLPRDAVAMTYHAVERALRANAAKLTREHVELAIRKRAEDLATGLTSEDWDTLAFVRRRGDIPDDGRAARLFADGRILVYPPQGRSYSARFLVHPVLEQEIDGRMAAQKEE